MKKRLILLFLATLSFISLGQRNCFAEKGGIQELAKKVDILAEEIRTMKENQVFPEEEIKLESEFGLGPAASKVYKKKHGISIGGYAEAFYKSLIKDRQKKSNSFDFTRFILYTGYKFSDKILFNAEIEFEHASTDKSGSVSVEFAYLDFLLSDYANIRAGMMLMPVGFINEMHEPVTYHGNNRPEMERQLIPTTWRENGVGIFGNVIPQLEYRLYAVNGMDAKNFSSSGIRGGRQKGSKALAESVAFTGRLDYTPLPGLLLGGSFYYGDSGQNQDFDGERLDVRTSLYEVHGQYHYRGLELRALGVWGNIGDTTELSKALGETIGKRQQGWYVETAYNFLPLILPDTDQYLAPFVRYQEFDPLQAVPEGFDDDPNLDTQVVTLGLTYKPHPQVVLKADYRDFTVEEGKKADEVNIGLGFIF